MIRLLNWIAGVAALAVVAFAAWDAATFDRAAWRADYARLKHDMAQHYANLDWMREHRGLDVVKLDRETGAALDRAWFSWTAHAAIRRFVAAFDDPHLELRPRAQGRPVAEKGAASCEAEGYRERSHAFARRWRTLPGWQAVGAADANFPAAMIGTTGVIRIAQFGEDSYLAACKRAFGAAMSPEALAIATRMVLGADLAKTLAALEKRGAVRLLVDVSGNGGGSEWVRDVIAMMTTRWLTRPEARRATPACDRGAVWTGKPACPVFFGEPARDTIKGTGGWYLDLLIYANRDSASATEDFIAWLHRDQVATLLGERTYGAGCGYIDGGFATRFTAAPIEVKMPNCARFLDNGVNEIEGQAPDIAIDDRASDAEWARQLVAALARSATKIARPGACSGGV